MAKSFKKFFSVLFLAIFFSQSLFYTSFANENNKNYGLFSYSYRYVSEKYHPGFVNIGDYIQSLAAKQFFPESGNSILIDRDNLGLYNGEKVKMIMNSWYFINKNNHAFSANIDPVFVSLHINNPEDITDKTINYLKKYQPIGCRDYATQVALAKKGVKTYFSSCLTTTLDEKYKAKENERTNEIVFCDYKFGDCSAADEYIKSLSFYDFSNLSYVSHRNSKSLSHAQRFKIAQNLLKKYAKAKLVVTSRIHCALPCLALGTPVILVNPDYDCKRFDGLYDLLNTIGINENGEFQIRVNVDKNGKVFNSKDYLKYANTLKNKVKEKLSEKK